MKRINPSGMTLIEMLMVVVLIAILATLALPVYGWIIKRAGFAGCVSNLRIMHTGFNTYMQDNSMIWPQLPNGPTTVFGNESDEWKWWHDTLEPHDVARTNWFCPNDKETAGGDKKAATKGDVYVSSYIPTTFDEFPNTAFRWKQPWVIERGGFHFEDKGPNLLMPDGTVQQGPVLP